MIALFNVKKEDLFLFAIFVIISLAIILKSYFHFDGYISPDSGYYLACAEYLKNGDSFLISAYEYQGEKNEYFAIWPIGYPLLIAAISILTGTSVFWASKILNIILIGFLFLILRSLFKNNAYVYGLIFFFSSYLEIASFTWSENFFLTSIVFFGYSITRLMTSTKSLKISLVLILLSSILLFLARYVGVFSIGVLFWIYIYFLYFKIDKKKAKVVLCAFLFNIIFVFLYLYNNYLQTELITGINRPSSVEANIELIKMLFVALFIELVIPVHTFFSVESKYLTFTFTILQLLIVLLIYFIFRQSINNFFKINKIPILSLVFFFIGFSYLFIMIALRWIIHFDNFGYRLLSPGMLMLFIGVIYYVLQNNSFKVTKIFLIFFLPLTIASLVLNFPIKIIFQQSKNQLTYNQNKEKIINEYLGVEKNSIIIFSEPRHLRYLRIDLERRNPHHFEKWEDFLNRIDHNETKEIYLKVPSYEIDTKYYHLSILKVLEKYRYDKLVRIR